jgi:hypothetical protein
VNSFIIAVEAPTPEEANAITKLFQGKPEWGFWHYLSNFWIVTTGSPATTASLSEMIDQIIARKLYIVLSVSDQKTYFGRLPNEAHDWFSKTWFGGKAPQKLPN